VTAGFELRDPGLELFNSVQERSKHLFVRIGCARRLLPEQKGAAQQNSEY
jgi:hypothetical protein